MKRLKDYTIRDVLGGILTFIVAGIAGTLWAYVLLEMFTQGY